LWSQAKRRSIFHRRRAAGGDAILGGRAAAAFGGDHLDAVLVHQAAIEGVTVVAAVAD